MLSCNTQRSGDIMKECNLKLNEPDPLYFEEIIKHNIANDVAVLNLLNKQDNVNGLTADDISKMLGMRKNDFYVAVKKSLSQGLIEKIHGRPVIYKKVSS